ncbi:DUF883 family protein [Paraburkholderia hospita]|nr:DUF883 family protein [Paraburkholderia hospita]AUT76411.1 DUF883 domain-containing protein [Paraburkholderia hospita]AXF06099.1 DUF883 domain-containing protein [Paraburkholderia hospita]OUL80825.1 hypothetical protein CA603_31140 [Paraburkholderia hospita]OUL87611.1 hypothetical protein CA602_13545 [Paraburkholderia hospita]OUL93905.1 hypothetical protein CA601_09210 [Paraburkholderia hospita]
MAESYQSTSPGSAGSFQQNSNAAVKSDGSDTERGNVSKAISDVKDKIASAQDLVQTKYRVVSETTDDFVHESPWKSVAMALIGGVVIGMLIAR